jgi:glycosyltransferase involved in cell wall biosynthesis
VARDLQRQRCDVVHVLNFSQFVPVIRRFNPASGIVLHMQCDWLAQVDPAMIEARLADADLVLGCSEYIAREVKKAFPRFGERCRAVYNGVDVGQFAPGDGISARAAGGSARILFVGRVSPEKGVHILLDAFKTVHEHQSGTHLDIVGPHGAPPREFIVSLSRDPKVTDLIRFYHRDYRSDLEERLPGDVAKQVSYVGDVPYAELPNRYRSADVFAFPSVWDEPFGMPNVEAMACGVPVVATRGGGIPELVEDGKTGFLVERGDAAGLAEAVLTLLKNESLRKSMGKAGRRRVMQLFTWKRVADDLLNQYSTIDRRRARAAAV